MAMVTKKRDGSAIATKDNKPFAWSWSRIKNFEVCPKRYYETDVLKKYNDGDNNEDLQWGETVHKAMAARCAKGDPLPNTFPPHYEEWCRRVLNGGGDIHVELETAIDTNFGPAPWFAARDGSGAVPWFRAKIDFVKIKNNIALLVDWKTGRIQEDSFQLGLSAANAFAKWPQLQAVRCSYVWLKEDAESSETFYRNDMPILWKTLWPRIQALASAHQAMNFPPVTSRMCARWCRVVSCPNHGKSF